MRDVTYNYFQFLAMCEQTVNMDVGRVIQAACLKLGYSSLRKEQEQAVKNFVSGKAFSCQFRDCCVPSHCSYEGPGTYTTSGAMTYI